MEKKNYILLGLALTILLTALVLYQSNIKRIQGYNRWVSHTLEVTYLFEKLASDVKSIHVFPESIRKNHRNNLLEYSGYDSGGVAQDLSELRVLIADNRVQLDRLNRISQLVDIYLANSPGIRLEDSTMTTESGSRLMPLISIQYLIDKAVIMEKQLLNGRKENLDNYQTISSILRGFCVAIGLIIILAITGSNIYQTYRRNRLESFLSSVLNTAQTGILACEAIREKDRIVDFKIIFSNNALQKQLELKDGEVMQQTLLGASPSSVKRGTFARYVHATESGKADEFETSFRRDHEMRWYQVSVSKLNDGFIASLSEITDLKNSQQELQRKVMELQRINGELEQFAYVASHDLQEPLRKIKTFSSLIIERFNDPAASFAKVYLEKVVAAANRMSRLINDLLNFSSLSDQTQQFLETDLNTLLRDICNDFELTIEEKGAVINCGDLYRMEAIPLQMNQLFYNLLNNALKFSKAGEAPEITVSATLLQKEAVQQYTLNPELTYQEIVVRDNGIGFNPDYAKKIFVIFQRLNSKELFTGTGIGLALCQKIVANHNGYIFAESKEREGASFHVILPLRQPAYAKKPEAALTV